MQPLSRSKYRAYKKEALKRGDTVFERDEAASIFQASFYEADKVFRKYNATRTVSLILVGSAAIASGAAVLGFFF